jgi:hypothetical protein
MKRPDTNAVFAPVEATPEMVAVRLLGLALDEMSGSLGRYFVKLEYDTVLGSYEPVEESLDLKDRDDLLNRVRDQKNCMWRFHVSMEFASNYVYPAVFLDPQGKPEVTVLLVIDPAITRFIETAEETRAAFVVFLARVAKAIGSTYFLSGLYMDIWKPITATEIMNRSQLGPRPFVVGWKSDALEDRKVVEGLGLQIDDVKRTTLSYHFVTFF